LHDFQREVNENCALQGTGTLNLEDGTDRLFRKVGKELPLVAP